MTVMIQNLGQRHFFFVVFEEPTNDFLVFLECFLGIVMRL